MLEEIIFSLSDEEIIGELIRRHNSTKHYVSKEIEERFLNAYKVLPKAGREIVKAYKEIVLSDGGRDPKGVLLVLIGGRAKGKPLVEDSDIDLTFAIGDLNGHIGRILRSREDLRPEDFGNTSIICSYYGNIINIKNLKSEMCKIAKKYNIKVPIHCLGIGDYATIKKEMLNIRPYSIPIAYTK
ncbi:MAG: hypothetical protein QXU20_00885 [Candidatus Woesearchaeota archaeon]